MVSLLVLFFFSNPHHLLPIIFVLFFFFFFFFLIVFSLSSSSSSPSSSPSPFFSNPHHLLPIVLVLVLVLFFFFLIIFSPLSSSSSSSYTSITHCISFCSNVYSTCLGSQQYYINFILKVRFLVKSKELLRRWEGSGFRGMSIPPPEMSINTTSERSVQQHRLRFIPRIFACKAATEPRIPSQTILSPNSQATQSRQAILPLNACPTLVLLSFSKHMPPYTKANVPAVLTRLFICIIQYDLAQNRAPNID
ncbi:hypothetical protein FPHYL_1385 [Fusarium phyllophilum]|uniref:Uncharacterized protein n=1 Tax=Fusarium phyllophilum TaxID=47803 RepID=A0A8H5KDU8_9HYPO|nr:hypothetical protein FPHYL_1385 [Fusarium phyllophilum]